MLKIWGRISSINVRKVVLAAQWLEIPFERIDAGHEFGIVKTPDYLAKNPNALVPLIEDGDFQLWESNVIVRYLCAKHSPGKLYPQELAVRFDAERWMDWQQTTLNPAGRTAFIQLVRTPADKRDAQTGRAIGRGHRAADGAARCASVAPRLHGGRCVHHGRHSHRLRAGSLARPAAGAAGTASPRTLVPGRPGPARHAWRARSSPVLKARDAATQLQASRRVHGDALSRQSAGRGARWLGPFRRGNAALRALDQPVRDHFPVPARQRRRRLPRPHLHARRRTALRRPPHPGQLPRLAGGRRKAARPRLHRAGMQGRPGQDPPGERARWPSPRRRSNAAPPAPPCWPRSPPRSG